MSEISREVVTFIMLSPTPQDFIMGMYTLERVGIGHDAKEEVRAAAAKCSVEDFFGVSAEAFLCSSPLPLLTSRQYSHALTSTFFAGKVGIDVKVDFPTALALLPRYRPYKLPPSPSPEDDDMNAEDFDEYADQLSMLCTLVLVLSNFGELRLSEALLPQEHAYLGHPVHVTKLVASGDVHLLGELCHCLAVLGLDRDCKGGPLQAGLAYLRDAQLLTTGSWPARDNNGDAYSW